MPWLNANAQTQPRSPLKNIFRHTHMSGLVYGTAIVVLIHLVGTVGYW